jgi:hypothetical protein
MKGIAKKMYIIPVRISEEINHFRGAVAHEEIILKWILRKYGCKVDWICFDIECSGRRIMDLVFHEEQEFLDK